VQSRAISCKLVHAANPHDFLKKTDFRQIMPNRSRKINFYELGQKYPKGTLRIPSRIKPKYEPPTPKMAKLDHAGASFAPLDGICSKRLVIQQPRLN
jgi:hypothetical protein